MTRGRWVATFVLIGTTATCIDHQSPTSPAEPARLAVSAITQTLLTAGNNTVNQRIYTTASITPAPNALITVAVLGHNSSAAAAPPTLSGGGMTTWTVVATTSFDAVATPHKRLTVYRAMSASPGSGPITITFGGSQSNCQWIVSQWTGVDVSGVNGAGAIGQTAVNQADAVTGLSVALAAFANANNVGYGVFAVNKNAVAVTPGAGFTEVAEQPSGESPLSDLEAEWASGDNTIDASWVSSNAGALGVEIKASESGGGGGGVVSAAQSTVSASPASITAGGGPSTVTVMVKDASGNPISGAAVVLSATGTGNTLTQPAGTTDNNGVATGTLSSTMAESKTVSATANGTAMTQQATVTVTPGPVSASQSTVTASPSSFAPGGSATITVTAKDGNANPISGATVLLAATGAGSLTQPSTPTTASGVATGAFSSTVEGSVDISATIAGTAITQVATVQIASQPPASAIAHAVLTAGSSPVNQRVYTTASITPAPNALITVAVLGHNSSAAAATPTLSGGGMTTWTVVATTTFDNMATPHKRLTVYRAMSASPGSGPITITFSGSQSNSQWIVSQWTGVDGSGVNGAGAIGQTGTNRADAVTGLAVALAPFGNANNVGYGVFAVNKNVVAVTPGAGFTEIAEQPSAEGTLADLEAEWAGGDHTIDASWASANAGALGIEIKAGGGGPVGGTPTVVAFAGGGQTGLVGFAVNVPPAVLVRSASGTPIAGASVLFSVTGGGGSVTGSSALTDANGVARVGSWILATGTNTLSATVQNPTTTAGSPVSFSATGAPQRYHVDVRFVTSMTPSQQAAFTNAASRWETLIYGDVPDIAVSIPANWCEQGTPSLHETIDDIVIFALIVPIDGPDGILGQAGPCAIRSGSGFPVFGVMEFDAADVAILQADGQLDLVIEHEMGHVLGYGTIWESNVLVGAGGSDPRFVGPQALAAFDQVGGAAYVGNKVPVENCCGPGTRDSHWRESAMRAELMTGFLDAGVNPLSVVTTASMGDLGYQVNYAGSDPYLLTMSLMAQPARVRELGNDVLRLPVMEIDAAGTVLRVLTPQ
ncbi:MAG TPA: Ig-like domain-containing protein [Gemmatimonadales bacterium]|nr:Ig-like domain-containing protein [Gemmatimonadales bacterium]